MRGLLYIDLAHAEICLPEIRSAYEFVKYYHAMLRIAAAAQGAANEKLSRRGQRLQVLVNNSDGQGNSWGAHTNFMVRRATFDDIAFRKIHYLLFLASYQASSIVFSGQGKVGSEDGQPPVAYQLTQRGDFTSCVCGWQTTTNRPIVNLRDEPLCGGRDGPWARLHVIFYDASLCHVATYLKFGVMQIVLGMIASGRVNLKLILDDPVRALHGWGHDITLTRRCKTIMGQKLTAVELQLRFLEEARRFVASGRCDVPEAPRIMTLWEEVLLKLRAGDWNSLAPQLDWVLKFSVIRRAMQRNGQLSWNSPQVKCHDLLYGSLDAGEGLYWAFERAGDTQQIVPEPEIEQATTEPPSDSRAFARAMLLRRFGRCVESMDWDRMRFKLDGDAGGGGFFNSTYRTLEMSDPLGMTRQQVQRHLSECKSLAEMLDALGAASDAADSPAIKSTYPVPGGFYGSATDSRYRA